MEQAHRDKILCNLRQLVQIRNLNSLHTELLARKVFTPDMLENIQGSKRSTSEQVQQLFVDCCKRGPRAFEHIVQALAESGNITQARLLDPNADFFNSNLYKNESVEPHDSIQHEVSTVPIPVQAEKAYKMTSIPIGFALIINVVDFDGNPDLKRDGAEKDALSLKRVLNKLGYEVFEVVNPKKKELLCRKDGILKKFTDRFAPGSVDSCVVAIMSHGEDNFWIQTSDCESIKDECAHLVHLWDDILPRFNNANFPIMKNKPKLFIIQSCRGERVHRSVRVVPAIAHQSQLRIDFGKRQITADKYYEHDPEFNHMILLQSTIPGYVTIRHEENGSPFIQTICQVFDQLGQHLPLTEMIPVIARKLQELPAEEGGPQTCTFKTVGYVRPFQFASNQRDGDEECQTCY